MLERFSPDARIGTLEELLGAFKCSNVGEAINVPHQNATDRVGRVEVIRLNGSLREKRFGFMRARDRPSNGEEASC